MPLILNADDFGMCDSVNDGVLHCIDHGVLNSVSLMVNMPGSKAAAAQIRRRCGIRIGLHLALVGGQPIGGPYRYLADERGLMPRRATVLVLRLLRYGRRMLDEIETELRLQIGKFREMGLSPSHIDGHDHVQLFPPIGIRMIRAARTMGIPYMRCPVEWPLGRDVAAPARDTFVKLALSQSWGRWLRWQVRRSGLTTADDLAGLYHSGRMTSDTTLLLLRTYKRSLESNKLVEVMFHPGYRSDELMQLFPSDYCWNEEVDTLTSDAFRQLVVDLQQPATVAGF